MPFHPEWSQESERIVTGCDPEPSMSALSKVAEVWTPQPFSGEQPLKNSHGQWLWIAAYFPVPARILLAPGEPSQLSDLDSPDHRESHLPQGMECVPKGTCCLALPWIRSKGPGKSSTVICPTTFISSNYRSPIR